MPERRETVAVRYERGKKVIELTRSDGSGIVIRGGLAGTGSGVHNEIERAKRMIGERGVGDQRGPRPKP